VITVLLSFLALLAAAVLVRRRAGSDRRGAVHVLAISAALLVFALARAASSGRASQCALDLAPPGAHAIAKVHR
jgi:hypothetical protein